MRVLLDCRMATWSGVGRYTTGLARALAARDDLQLVQACRVGERPPVAPGGSASVVWLRACALGPAGALELARAAVRAAPDVVHSPHFPTPIPKRGPLVVTLHDLTPLLVAEVMPSPTRRVAYSLWNRRAAGVADRVIVPSHCTAADVERVLPQARGRVRVTPEAADDFAAGPVAEGTGSAGEWVRQPYVLAFGGGRAHKDVATLLRSWAELAPRWPDLRLILVGTDPQGPAAGAGPRVLSLGRVGDPELRALYAGAAVFAFPSRYEGFGLPPLEAMAFGAPVVCTDAASLPEVTGAAAVMFPVGDAHALADALSRVLGDAALRDRLSVLGRERAAQFTWARTASLTVVAYGEAIREWRRQRA
jgi:glycosyltransferase involved in cell wall biosynthesis